MDLRSTRIAEAITYGAIPQEHSFAESLTKRKDRNEGFQPMIPEKKKEKKNRIGCVKRYIVMNEMRNFRRNPNGWEGREVEGSGSYFPCCRINALSRTRNAYRFRADRHRSIDIKIHDRESGRIAGDGVGKALPLEDIRNGDKNVETVSIVTSLGTEHRIAIPSL